MCEKMSGSELTIALRIGKSIWILGTKHSKTDMDDISPCLWGIYPPILSGYCFYLDKMVVDHFGFLSKWEVGMSKFKSQKSEN